VPGCAAEVFSNVRERSGAGAESCDIAPFPGTVRGALHGEKEDARKWSLEQLLGFSVPYVLVVLISVLPFT
jgi:hypothetical protein